MPNRPRDTDAYIEQAPEFSVPILEKLRALFHKGCPDLTESIKWGFPHFEYKGILGNMAAFKKHVSVSFWKGQLMSDPKGLFEKVGSTSMAQIKISKLSELPSDRVLLSYIKEAVQLNDLDVKVPVGKPKRVQGELEVPAELAVALKKNRKALRTFERFSPSHRREYIEWITGAKQAATRQKRLATAIEWMEEGKPRNWKYIK